MRAAEKLLARDRLPEAIVAANDEAAIGVLMRLRDAGVDVPGDVSIAGIDDLRPARFVGLTTVSVPLHEMGKQAAHTVLGGYNAERRRAAAPAGAARATDESDAPLRARIARSARRSCAISSSRGRSQIAGLRISTSIGPT